MTGDARPSKEVVAPTLHPADFFTRQALTEYVFAHQFLWRSVHHGLSLNLWPEVAEHFHRTLISDVRTRRVGQPAVAVHNHVRHAVAGEQRRCRRACRSCTHDQNVSFDIRHIPSPRSSGPPACGEPETNAGRRGPRSGPIVLSAQTA